MIRYKCPRCGDGTLTCVSACDACLERERERLAAKRANPEYRAAENRRNKLRMRRRRARRDAQLVAQREVQP